MSSFLAPRGGLKIAVLLTALSLWPLGTSSRAHENERISPVVTAVARVSGAVVNISAEKIVLVHRDPFFDRFFSDFSEAPARQHRLTQKNLGSGVILRDNGFIVTNAHVVARGENIRILMADDREFAATIVGTDEDSDLAVLKIEAEDLPSIPLATSTPPLIGETVIAIGNPFGFSHSVTTGVISATGRSLRTNNRNYLDFIQTDASINPGNSGGPLLNIKGDLIGINTAIYGDAQNIGFAIPANRAHRIVEQLINFGEVRRGHLGVHIQNLTPALADALEIPHQRGVVVHRVEEESPAFSAGIVRGDVIIAVDGKSPRNGAEFQERLARVHEGEFVGMTILRDGKTLDKKLKATPLSEEVLQRTGWRRLGIRIDRPETRGGMRISAVRERSAAAGAGIRPGDILLAIELHTTDSQAAFGKAILKIRRKGSARFTLRRGRSVYQLGIRLDN